jgi:hypothetical protein
VTYRISLNVLQDKNNASLAPLADEPWLQHVEGLREQSPKGNSPMSHGYGMIPGESSYLTKTFFPLDHHMGLTQCLFLWDKNVWYDQIERNTALQFPFLRPNYRVTSNPTVPKCVLKVVFKSIFSRQHLPKSPRKFV